MTMSPDGRYLAMITPSQVADGCDLWVLDLRRKVGRIVAVNQDHSGDPIYQSDRIVIPSTEGEVGLGLVVDLRNLTARPLELPTQPREER
jgi:hypothetical protein